MLSGLVLNDTLQARRAGMAAPAEGRALTAISKAA